MTSRPVWLFDSPLLRQALAQVNLSALPAIVRAACGLSQRDIAAMVGWSPAALSLLFKLWRPVRHVLPLLSGVSP